MRHPLTRSSYALGIAALVALGACSPDTPTSPNATRAPGSPSASMAAPDPSVAHYEVFYMEFTIDHHLAGIAEAQLCVDRAIHPELKHMCMQSIASQQHQIAQLRSWLKAWYGIDYTGKVDPSAIPDIQALSQLQGAHFETEFLDRFSKHHIIIINESRKAVHTVDHTPLRDMAQTIIAAQTQQVIMMQTWNCQWYNRCSHTLINQARGA